MEIYKDLGRELFNEKEKEESDKKSGIRFREIIHINCVLLTNINIQKLTHKKFKVYLLSYIVKYNKLC